MPLFSESGFGQGAFGLRGADYYQSLLTSEYRNAAMMNASLLAALGYLEDIAVCLASFDQAFDLDYAVGVQLDTLGLIIGQSRYVGFQPSNGVSPVLDDETYRILLKARVGQNHWDGLRGSLQPIWQTLFPAGRIIIIDGQNMTATVVLTGTFTSIMRDLIVNGYIVPRPETVMYTYAFGSLPVFGADLDNTLIAGADVGHAA